MSTYTPTFCRVQFTILQNWGEQYKITNFYKSKIVTVLLEYLSLSDFLSRVNYAMY